MSTMTSVKRFALIGLLALLVYGALCVIQYRRVVLASQAAFPRTLAKADPADPLSKVALDADTSAYESLTTPDNFRYNAIAGALAGSMIYGAVMIGFALKRKR